MRVNRETKGNMSITKPSEFGAALKRGAYAWPGGYPTFFVTSDGGCLCFQCAMHEAKRITESIREGARDGWRVETQDVNWEDAGLYCDHCNERIESAYAEDEAKALLSGRRQV